MIGGFIVRGSEPEPVIIRAIGPELTQYGVPNVLADPTIELHNGIGALIASNDNWQNTIIGGIITQSQVQEIINSGLAPRQIHASRQSLQTFRQVTTPQSCAVLSSTIGVALVEAYDVSPNADSILR